MWNHVLLPSNQTCAGRLGMCDAAAYVCNGHAHLLGYGDGNLESARFVSPFSPCGAYDNV